MFKSKKTQDDVTIYLKQLVEKSGDVFWIRSADYSTQLYISPAYESIWGRSSDDLYLHPQRWIETIIPEDRERLKKSITLRNPTIEPGQSFLTSYRIRLPNKEIRWIEDESFPIFNKKNEHIGFAGIAKNITEKKNRELSLGQAKKEAEGANLAKSEFIANMSHDVKTPLSGILALADVLSSRLKDEEHYAIAKNIYNSGLRLMDFFENCLELSQLEISHSSFIDEPFNLKTLLDELSELFQANIKEKNLFFSIQFAPNLPHEFLGSRAGLYRILLNLIGNAIKFTHTGGITIDASLTEKSTEKAPILKIIVEDSGIGIPKDKQKLVFKRFSRVAPAYSGTYKGTGIGLYIVRKFVKAMQGEVYLQSVEGEGSRFILALPMKISLLNANEYIKMSEPYERRPFQEPLIMPIHKTASMNPHKDSNQDLPKILFIEDDYIAQTMGKIILSELGHEVDLANSGQKALELFEPGKYHLIFMDIGLPDTEGDKLTKQIRALEKGSDYKVPIIGLTAHATGRFKENCLKTGMQDVLNKPLSAEKAKIIIQHYARTFPRGMQDEA